ncbi:MAG: hypothetical protein E5V57_07665 [Mesorhizobium sp.]|nr:MAG: hypothetical protein E5V57_07665 [Mesorhizobium sp.]
MLNAVGLRCPHCPAGLFSPYSDGEKDAVTNGFASCLRCKMGAKVAAISLLPVTIRGEGAGRRMRGGADTSNASAFAKPARDVPVSLRSP